MSKVRETADLFIYQGTIFENNCLKLLICGNQAATLGVADEMPVVRLE